MVRRLLQLAIQVPAHWPSAALPRAWPDARAVGSAWRTPAACACCADGAGPAGGVSVAQLSLLINTQIASHLGARQPSWLYYADRLMEFPPALLGVALGWCCCPQLSAARPQRPARLLALLDWGLRLVLLLACPARPRCWRFRSRWWPPCSTTAVHAGDVGATLALMRLRRRADGPGRREGPGAGVTTPGRTSHAGAHRRHRLVLTQVMNLVVPWLGHAGLRPSIGLGAWSTPAGCSGPARPGSTSRRRAGRCSSARAGASGADGRPGLAVRAASSTGLAWRAQGSPPRGLRHRLLAGGVIRRR